MQAVGMFENKKVIYFFFNLTIVFYFSFWLGDGLKPFNPDFSLFSLVVWSFGDFIGSLKGSVA